MKVTGAKVVIVCLILQVAITWAWQLHYPHLLGTDAYYLVVQAQSVLSTGSLKIPDGDPIPFLMAGIMRMGATGEAAFKITIAVIHGLMTALLVGMLLGQRSGRGVFLGCLALVMGESVGLYHVFEFPKLSLALVTFFTAIAVYRTTAVSRVAGVALFAVATLVHPAVWPVAVLSLGILVWSDDQFGKHRPAIYLASTGLMILSASYFLFRQGSGILDRYMEASGGPGLVVFMSRNNLPRFLQIEVSFMTALIVCALCFYLIKKKYVQATVYGALLLLTMLPTSANEMFGVGERITLIVAIVALPIMMMVVARTSSVSTGDVRTLTSGTVAVATVCLTVLWIPSVFGDVLSTNDYTALRAIVEKVQVRKPEILIAQRSLSFYYTALTGRDAFAFDPDQGWDRSRIWRVAFGVDVSEILYFAPTYCAEEPGLTESVSQTDVVLIREDCWEAFRERVSRDELPGLWEMIWDNEKNPSKMRPQYLKNRYSSNPI